MNYLNTLRTEGVFDSPEQDDTNPHFLVGCTLDPGDAEQLEFLNPMVQEELKDPKYYPPPPTDEPWPQLIFGLDRNKDLTMRVETYEDCDMEAHGEEHVDEQTMISRLKEIKKVCDLYGP